MLADELMAILNELTQLSKMENSKVALRARQVNVKHYPDCVKTLFNHVDLADRTSQVGFILYFLVNQICLRFQEIMHPFFNNFYHLYRLVIIFGNVPLGLDCLPFTIVRTEAQPGGVHLPVGH